MEKKKIQGCGAELMFDGDVQLCCGKAFNFREGKEKVPVNQYGEVILCEKCQRLNETSEEKGK